MRELNIRLKGATLINPTIVVDRKRVRVKKNKFGTYEATHNAENSRVEVCVYKYLEINSPLWLIIGIFFYIISIFGILDPIREKKPIVLESKFIVDLGSETNGKLELSINLANKYGRAMEYSSNCALQEIKNISREDERAKKRLKILKVVKVGIFITSVLGIILLLR